MRIKNIFAILFTILLLNTNQAFAYSDDLDLLEIDSYDIEDESSNNDIADPLEPLNRMIFGLNYNLDFLIFKPVANSYRILIPEEGRKRVRNVIHNSFEPLTFINALLQFDLNHAFNTFWRFTLNTTFGLGGMFDFAGEYANLHHRPEDFGQTLGTWGVGNGFYIMWPILGPSSLRDTTGKIVDMFLDPIDYITEDNELESIRYGISALDNRERLLDVTNDIEKNSLDLYSSVKSLYIQHRNNVIKNGAKDF